MVGEHRTICYNVWCLQLRLGSMATEDPLSLAVSLGMKHCQQSLLYQGLSPCLLELWDRGRWVYPANWFPVRDYSWHLVSWQASRKVKEDSIGVLH